MKNFLKSSLIICLILIVNSCSKDSDTPDEVIDTPAYNPPTGTVAIEGDLDIKFEDLTALTIDGEGDVDEKGAFNIDLTSTTNEELPILFLKNDEIMFGYYSKTGAGNTISIDDILLFYFTVHPEVAKQGINNTELLAKIKANVNYTKLKNLTSISLDADTSPFKNNVFVELLNESGYSIGITARSDKQNKLSKKDDYRYSYTRDGTVSWPSKFPVYCTVGLEVVNAQTKESASGPQILDKSGLVFSPGSGIMWLYDYITEDESENTGQFKFPSEGEYVINFSNGVDNYGTPDFESKVDGINRVNLGIDVISFMIPIGIEKVLGKADCRDALVSFFKGISLTGIKSALFLNGNLNKVEVEKELFNISNDIYDEIVKCALQGNGIKFIDAIKDFGDKYLNKVEDGASIMLFLRDYLVSDIKGTETRYFYDKVSFGELSQTNLSGLEYINSSGHTEFIGTTGSEHTYSTKVEEKIVKYKIERGLFKSTAEAIPEEELAIGIPFNISNISNGDATVKEAIKAVETRVDGTIIAETSINGTLDVKFKMGTQDSQFEIKPEFDGKGLPASEKIDLKIPVDSIPIYEAAVVGTWTVITLPDNGGRNNLIIEPDGRGFYDTGSGSGGDDGNGHYFINWYIAKENGKYHLRESGFYHYGFEQYRTLDVTLSNNYLTYPVSSFKTYAHFSPDPPYESRLYTKN